MNNTIYYILWREITVDIIDVDATEYCQAHQRQGLFHKGKLIHHLPMDDAHRDMAMHLLDLNRRRETPQAPKWITVGVVSSLRQSLREAYAQGWDMYATDFIDITYGQQRRMTKAQYRLWMQYARRRDAIHHGEPTF